MKTKSVKITQLVKDILNIRKRNLHDRCFKQKSAFLTVYQCESNLTKPIVDDTKSISAKRRFADYVGY